MALAKNILLAVICLISISNGAALTHDYIVTDITERLNERSGSLQLLGEIEDESNMVQLIMDTLDGLPQQIYRNLQNTSSNCGRDFGTLSETSQKVAFSAVGLNLTVSQALLAVDASGKPVPEILQGNIQFKGGFDECMSLETSDHSFSMQYMYISLTFVFVQVLEQPPVISIFPVPMNEYLCIPDSCTSEDINSTFTMFNDAMLNIPLLPDKVLIYTSPIQPLAMQQSTVDYSNGAIVMIFVSCLFLFFAGIGTIYELMEPFFNKRDSDGRCPLMIINNLKNELEEEPLLDKELQQQRSRFRSLGHDILLSFSLYKTVPAILSSNQPQSAITSINGMRVISMFWVILCHTYAFFQSEFKNPIYVFIDWTGRFSAQPIINGYFSVDSFFFLSGLLVAYLTFREMERKHGKFPYLSFYIHRIARLTPVYMFVLFLYWYLAMYITNGPNLQVALGKNSVGYKNCEKYWWTNFLYINNFYPTKPDDVCMGWTWYLANDMQFYIISPLFLIPLYHFLPIGLVSLVICLLAAMGVTGFISGYYGYYANVLYTMIGGKPLDPNIPDQMQQIYIKPYCRIFPYLVGIFLGYVIYKKYRITFPPIINYLCYGIMWLIAIVTGITNVYGLYSTFHGHVPSKAEDVLYYMLSRFTWGVTLGLVVYACHNGYGGVINRFLSLPFWVPLGRLTYTAYLVHEAILLIILGEMRDGMYFSDMMIVIYIIANIVLSFGAAFAISLFVEFPISNLERSLFKFFGNPLRSTTRTAGTDPLIVEDIQDKK